MESQSEKVIQVAEVIQPITLGINHQIKVEGFQLVSRKLLQIINHILTQDNTLIDAFDIAPDYIKAIKFSPNFDHIPGHEAKFGVFDPEAKEIGVNLQRHFDAAKDAVKEGENMELLCIRGHLWLSLLTTMFHEFLHAVSYAIDPEATGGADKEEIEETISEQANVELANFVRDFECEPAMWADEPFYGTRFMEFMIKEVRDNAEAWALAQHDIYRYNEQNNTHVIWKDGDTGVDTFRKYFSIGYEYFWDNEPKSLVELTFGLTTPTTTALEAPETGLIITDEDVLDSPDNEDTLDKVDASPFHEGDAGAKDREALVGDEMVKKTLNVEGTVELPASEIANIVDILVPAEDEATAVLAERGKMLNDKSDEAHLSAQYEWPVQDALSVTDREMDPEAIALQHADLEDPGDFDADEPFAAHPEIPVFPSPAPTIPAAPPATVATGTPLPPAPQSAEATAAVMETTPEPSFAPTTGPAPPTGVIPPTTSPPQTGYSNQALRTDLPNHNFTAQQMKEMCEQVFLRCVNHIFAKCGWSPGMNPPFTPELRGAIMEPISMSGIPNIENFLIGMDIVDPTTGTYVINSPANSHGGTIKGKVTQKQHLPSYTLYFNYNGMEIKRFIAPQNQWKLNAQGSYSNPAQRAQQGAQIAWIMDGDDNTSNKWRAKVENGVVEWFV